MHLQQQNKLLQKYKLIPNNIPVISKPLPLLMYWPLLILCKSILPHTIAAIAIPNTAKVNIVIIASLKLTPLNRISKISHIRSMHI